MKVFDKTCEIPDNDGKEEELLNYSTENPYNNEKKDPKSPRSFRFWLGEYFGIDVRALAVTRAALALLVLAQLIILFPNIFEFYSDAGLLNRAFVSENGLRSTFSIYTLSGSVFWIQGLFLIHAFFAFLLLIGFKTRITTIVVWFLTLSLFLASRPLMGHIADSLFVLMLLWGIFVPWGARFSIDAALNTSKSTLPKRIMSFGTAAMVLQMPIVYVFAAANKLSSDVWTSEFSALYYALRPEYLTTFSYYLTSFLSFEITQLFTVSALALQLLAPIFLFFPLYPPVQMALGINLLPGARIGIVFILAFFQLSLMAMTSVGLFTFISIAATIPLLPSRFWDMGRKKKVPVQIFYDPSCGFCKKMALIVRELFLSQDCLVQKASDSEEMYSLMVSRDSWVVVDRQGNRRFKFDAFVYILSQRLIFKPVALLLRLKPIFMFGNFVYDWVSHHRPVAGKAISFLKFKNIRTKDHVLVTILCAFLMVFTYTSSLVSGGAFAMPLKAYTVAQNLLIHPSWNMFSSAYTREGYITVEGELFDGRKVNLFDRGPIVVDLESALSRDPEVPRLSRDHYKNYRWRLMFQIIRKDNREHLRSYYPDYVCRYWNSVHQGNDQLESVEVFYISKSRDPSLDQEILEDSLDTKSLILHKC